MYVAYIIIAHTGYILGFLTRNNIRPPSNMLKTSQSEFSNINDNPLTPGEICKGM